MFSGALAGAARLGSAASKWTADRSACSAGVVGRLWLQAGLSAGEALQHVPRCGSMPLIAMQLEARTLPLLSYDCSARVPALTIHDSVNAPAPSTAASWWLQGYSLSPHYFCAGAYGADSCVADSGA